MMSLKKKLRRIARDAYFKTFELPLQELKDRPPLHDDWNFQIPNKLYQTWDTNFFGKSHYRAMQKFREINPDLHFIMYDTEQSDAFMRSYYKDHKILEIYEKSLAGPLKADIFRYCILYQFGGFYCDINKALTRPFSSFIQASDTAVISYETNYVAVPPDSAVYPKIRHPEKYVLQCVFGFQKQHIILQKMIENICTYYPLFAGKKFPKAKAAILPFTGPGMFTKVVWENVLSCENLRQVEIDFDGTFIFNLPGANVLYLNKVKYTGLTAYEIVRA